jgi:hypothetical protein
MGSVSHGPVAIIMTGAANAGLLSLSQLKGEKYVQENFFAGV